MCEDCFDEDDIAGARPAVTAASMRHARLIEQDLPGEPVSDEAWSIFFGLSSGSLVWSDHERMARCREGAELVMSMRGCRNAAKAEVLTPH